MLGIPREVAKHALRIIPGSKPTKQCLRRFDTCVALMATRMLLYYFTDHEVIVITSYPLGDIVHN